MSAFARISHIFLFLNCDEFFLIYDLKISTFSYIRGNLPHT
jgi:hypothetical protein